MPAPPDPLDPYLVALVRRKSRQLVGTAGIRPHDRQDVEHDLLVDVLPRLNGYVPGKLTREAFDRMLVRRAVSRLLRHRTAARRDDRHVVALGDTEVAGRNEAQGEEVAVDRRLDLAAALAALPPDDRALVGRVAAGSVAAVAREDGVPRTTLADHLRTVLRRVRGDRLAAYAPTPPTTLRANPAKNRRHPAGEPGSDPDRGGRPREDPP